MSKSNAHETAHLELLFNNVGMANVGDATGIRPSSVAGSLYYALHTADPGEAGTQSTNETAYTGYARQPVTRGAFIVTGNSVSPPADVDFGECTASPGAPLTHFSIGVSSSGAGMILYSGQLSPNINLDVGDAPRIKSASAITED